MVWTVQQDSQGNTHNVCLQNLDNSCGAACTAMVVRSIKKTGTDEALARREIFKNEVSFHQNSYYAWAFDGSYITSLTQALSTLGVTSARTITNLTNSAQLKEIYKSCTPLQPGIGRIAWSNGSGHFVLIKGLVSTGGNTLLIIDPWNGLQEVELGMLFPAYVPIFNGDPSTAIKNIGMGQFDYHWVVTTK